MKVKRNMDLMNIEDDLPDVPLMLSRAAATWTTQAQALIKPMTTVLFSQSCYLACSSHANSDHSHEVGGYIVGRTGLHKGHRYTLAEHALVAEKTNASDVRLQFTPESQLDMDARRECYFPKKRIVGWFHTHPHMSVFYSAYDLWLHTHFFRADFQFGLVIEPVKMTAGFFIWQQQGSDKPHLAVEQFAGCVELGDMQTTPIFQWHNLSNTLSDGTFSPANKPIVLGG